MELLTRFVRHSQFVSHIYFFACSSMSQDNEHFLIFSEHCSFSVVPTVILDANMIVELAITSLLISHSL